MKKICTNPRHLGMELEEYQLPICLKKKCIFVGTIVKEVKYSEPRR